MDVIPKMFSLLPPHSDPRADTYPLMASFTPTVYITLCYVFGVCAWSKLLTMRKSKNVSVPKNNEMQWDLTRRLMILYNFIMVFYSAILVSSGAYFAWKLGYGLGCVEAPDPTDHRTDVVVTIGYAFYFSKIVELLDTVFFLWRGKTDQVTFLHVFHHAAMPPSIWWGVKYAPGGIVYTFLVANSAVHVIMYTYYGMAAAGLYRYLWWKNYLTIAQMIQFVFLICHQSQVFLSSEPCNYPKIFPAAIIFYSTVFLILFGNFYVQAYWRKQRLVKHRIKVEMKEANGHVALNGAVTNGHVTAVREQKKRD